jgi:hypothetical protein
MHRGLVLLLFWSAALHAADMEQEDDSAALSLTGAETPLAATGRTIAVTVEGAGTMADQVDGREVDGQRLSADARYDGALGPGWRAVAAARLDMDWSARFDSAQEIGTLKEAYVSWQPRASVLLDAGRINGRQGVALGYNPTDFFRSDAIRSVVSIDPDSLRDNRLGTFMLRAQQLWNGGSLSAAYAPRLTEHASSAPLDPDVGATNSHDRWLVSLSQSLGHGWTPQWLAFGGAGQMPQLGVNMTALLGQALIAYAEVSGGRATSLWAAALNLASTDSYRSRAATGFTYSTPGKLSVTFEYEYNGAGLGLAGWDAARFGSPALYGRYRQYVLAQQDLPTRSGLFLYASWQDLVFRHLDLSAFLRQDLLDHSRLPYVELRRHWTSIDIALRWQDALGEPTSNYGASLQRQTWQLVLDWYL